MIRHVFKLVWNRKRSTGLVLIEILSCHLVLCGILAAGIHLTQQWRQPLGFDYEDVWSAEISGMKYGSEGDELAADRQAVSDMLRAIKDMPETEAAAISTKICASSKTISSSATGWPWRGCAPSSSTVAATARRMRSCAASSPTWKKRWC